MRDGGSRVLLLLVIFSVSTIVLSAKPWRGIEPLHSTRADVIRHFHQCTDQKEACKFEFNDESVYILFSGGLADNHHECAKRLTPETVMFIEIRPVKDAKFSRSILKEGQFEKFNPAAPWKVGFSGYLNTSEGLAIKTAKGRITQLVYLPAASDLQLCQSYYGSPESFIEIYKGHVPTISVECSRGQVADGEPVRFLAHSDFETKRGFEWRVSAGKIIAGQYTSTITVDTSGLSGQTIRVDAEVIDLDRYVSAVGECTMTIVAKGP